MKIDSSMQLEVVRQPNRQFAVYSKLLGDFIAVDVPRPHFAKLKAASGSNDAAKQVYHAYQRYLAGTRTLRWDDLHTQYAAWKTEQARSRSS
jgi:hypothetical protein